MACGAGKTNNRRHAAVQRIAELPINGETDGQNGGIQVAILAPGDESKSYEILRIGELVATPQGEARLFERQKPLVRHDLRALRGVMKPGAFRPFPSLLEPRHVARLLVFGNLHV